MPRNKRLARSQVTKVIVAEEKIVNELKGFLVEAFNEVIADVLAGERTDLAIDALLAVCTLKVLSLLAQMPVEARMYPLVDIWTALDLLGDREMNGLDRQGYHQGVFPPTLSEEFFTGMLALMDEASKISRGPQGGCFS